MGRPLGRWAGVLSAAGALMWAAVVWVYVSGVSDGDAPPPLSAAGPSPAFATLVAVGALLVTPLVLVLVRLAAMAVSSLLDTRAQR